MIFLRAYFLTAVTICLFLFVIGCGNKGSKRFDTALIINPTPIDSLKLDFVSSDTLLMEDFVLGAYADYQVVEDSRSSTLIGINVRDHALDFIDLSNKKSIGHVKFQPEGPDGISGNIDGFFYHNADSIFILSSDENRIYIMNDKGAKIDYFDFGDMPLPDGFDNYDVYADLGIQNGPFFNAQDRTLQFYTYRWVSAQSDDFSYKAFASFSIDDRTFKSTYGVYPEVFQKGSNYLFYNNPGLLVKDSLSYVYSGVSENIYCYNNNTGELLYVSTYHCEHWTGSPESVPIHPNSDLQQRQDWLRSQPAYISLLYNKQNDLFYRFLKHEQPVLNTAGLLNPRWAGKWCVGIFDNKMKPVGHVELPQNQLLPIISFVSSGILWIKNPSDQAKENQSLYYQLQLNGTD